MTALGIDIGSTSIKGAVLAGDSRHGTIAGLVEKVAFPGPVAGLPPGHFEVEPSLVLDATRAVLGNLLRRAPTASRLYLCGQMGGAVVCSSGGLPLSRYHSWRDQRTTQDNGAVGSLLQVAEKSLAGILPELGNELKAGSTSLLLHALALDGRLPAGGVPATLADFVAGALCGVAPRIHPTLAIGLMDLVRGGWHQGMIQRLELDRLAWQPPADLSTPIGVTTWAGKRLEVFAAVGDQQCALHGAGLEPGELSLNASTGAQVSQLSPVFQPVPYQTRHFLGGQFLQTNTPIPAGRALHGLVDLLTELPRAQGLPMGDPWGTLTRLAALAATDAGGLRASIAFFPSPVGDTGSLTGITLENLTAGNLLVAAVNNLAENLATCAHRLTVSGPWSRIRLSGGLSRDLPMLKDQIQQRLTGVLLQESVVEEETLAGLARIAAA